MNTSNLITYWITFKGLNNQEHTLPVISTSAIQAVTDLTTLGFDVKKVLHSFPSV